MTDLLAPSPKAACLLYRFGRRPALRSSRAGVSDKLDNDSVQQSIVAASDAAPETVAEGLKT